MDLIGRKKMVVVYIAIALSAFVRIANYSDNPSFHIDEANLARNVAERTIPQYWEKLDYEQYAPPLFLTLTKASVSLMGYHEYAFRLIPFICSLLTLVLLYYLSSRYIDNKAIIGFVIIIFGMSYLTILQSFTFKQYSLDLAISLSLFILAIRKDYSRFYNWKEIALWTLLGFVLVWLSMPAVFVFASITIYFAWQAYRKQKLIPWGIRYGIPLCVWIANFLVYFFTMLHVDASETYLQNYHASYFLTPTIWTVNGLQHNWKVIHTLLSAYITHTALGLTVSILLYLIGSFVLCTQSVRKYLLLVLPFALAMICSFWNYYSLIPRLLLFTFPIQIIVLGKGIETLSRSGFLVVRVLSTAMAVFLVVSMNGWKLSLFEHRVLEETRNSLEYVSQQKKPEDVLLVNDPGGPALSFYIQHYAHKENFDNCSNFEWVRWPNTLSESVKQTFQNYPKDTIWVILGHIGAKEAEQEIAEILSDHTLNILHQEIEWHSRAIKITKKDNNIIE